MGTLRRGAVELTDSEGTKFVLKFGTNAICNIQETLGKNINEILDGLKDEKNADMRTIRTMVQMAVVDPKDLTPEQAGDLIDDVGFEEVTKAFGGVFGTKKAGTNGDGPANPPESSS